MSLLPWAEPSGEALPEGTGSRQIGLAHGHRASPRSHRGFHHLINQKQILGLPPELDINSLRWSAPGLSS